MRVGISEEWARDKEDQDVGRRSGDQAVALSGAWEPIELTHLIFESQFIQMISV
jgi:hypothetical protein